MNCNCTDGKCIDWYSDDKPEDYLIERLTHIENEIAYIKRILQNKSKKEDALYRLAKEAEIEEKKKAIKKPKISSEQQKIQQLIDEIKADLKKDGYTNVEVDVYKFP